MKKNKNSSITQELLNLRATFEELNSSVTGKANGVWHAHSKKPGPIVGITIFTHGNEPSGLAAYHYFRHTYQLESRIQRGDVYFVLNNQKAAKQYFTAVVASDENAKLRARFVDINMNRLPDNPFSDDSDKRYEIRRARELRNIWAQFQYALDIHSTSQPTRPMIIALTRSDVKMVSRFPITTVVSNIDAVQSGKPACYFYGERKAVVYGIEVGSHEVKYSLRRAITCTRTFLALLDMIPKGKLSQVRDQVEYEVFNSVWFPNASYALTRSLKNFEFIHKGRCLATGNKQSVIASMDCYALMPPQGKKPASLKEEVLFLTLPPRHLQNRK